MYRKEGEKSLAQWGFKDLEAVVLHQTVERSKGEEASAAAAGVVAKPAVLHSAPCDVWVADRFDDLHCLLSGETKLAYATSGFLTHRPLHPKFIQQLREADRGRWAEMLASPHPWDVHFTMSMLNQSLDEYQKGNAKYAWVVQTGERIYAPLVDLLEKLSQLSWAILHDWQFCSIPCVQVLEGLMKMGSHLLSRVDVDL